MNTPTPSAHSGEQGKPSDRSIAAAFEYCKGSTFAWPCTADDVVCLPS